MLYKNKQTAVEQNSAKKIMKCHLFSLNKSKDLFTSKLFQHDHPENNNHRLSIVCHGHNCIL